MPRESIKERETKETKIKVKLNIDGQAKTNINSSIAFLDHMIELFSKQSAFDIELLAKGDIDVDLHHTVEDIAIVLGGAFNEALGSKEKIERYASAIVPMDEALVLFSVDISGRPFLGYDIDLPREEVGGFNTDLLTDFMQAFVANAGITLHMRLLAGRNSHHIIEAIFKGLGLVLGKAVKQTREDIPSTKGVL